MSSPLMQRISNISLHSIGFTAIFSTTSSPRLLKAHARRFEKGAPLFTTGLSRSVSDFFQREGNIPPEKPPVPLYTSMATLETLNFDNLALRSLPVDHEEKNFPRQVKGACFSKVKPTPVENPEIVAYAPLALQLLDIPDDQVKREEFAEYFAGNKLLPGSDPSAHCYCGHQFGYFSGQLGDGAAIYLGEVVNKAGERWELQLKGAGLTPYSRQADGRKVLRSSIREFLCSEAMYHLGIPTTRAGSCITSDSTVIRDIFYSGNPVKERCTIISRIAPSFIRFGSFQICKPPDRETGREGPSVCMPHVLKQLTDYTIKTFYPQIWEANKEDHPTAVLEFFREVVLRTARLVAEWQCVGWCHGVLNTDNMSILGLTIDYGPYGFVDRFEKDFICNSSDDGGRYSYKNQPEMCKWNCLKLADALQEFVPMDQLRPTLELFDEEFQRHYMSKMRKKLGLLLKEVPEDKDLVGDFFETMEKTGADFTNSFRVLSQIPLPINVNQFEPKVEQVKELLLAQSCSLEELRVAHKPRMETSLLRTCLHILNKDLSLLSQLGIGYRTVLFDLQKVEVLQKLKLQMILTLMEMNPGLLAQMGRGARTVLRELERMEKVKALQDKTEDWKRTEDDQCWTAWLTRYKARLLQEVDGAASNLKEASKNRTKVMNENNPKFVLRNYIAQNAIDAAEEGDFTEVQNVLKILQNPYSEDLDLGQFMSQTKDEAAGAKGTEGSAYVEATSCSSKVVSYDSKPPVWASELRVT